MLLRSVTLDVRNFPVRLLVVGLLFLVGAQLVPSALAQTSSRK